MVAPLAAAPIRPRVATAGQSTRIRRPQRKHLAAVRTSRGVVAPPDLSLLQSARRRYHRGVAVVLWHRRAEAALGRPDPASRKDRVAGNERTRSRLRPR